MGNLWRWYEELALRAHPIAQRSSPAVRLAKGIGPVLGGMVPPTASFLKSFASALGLPSAQDINEANATAGGARDAGITGVRPTGELLKKMLPFMDPEQSGHGEELLKGILGALGHPRETGTAIWEGAKADPAGTAGAAAAMALPLGPGEWKAAMKFGGKALSNAERRVAARGRNFTERWHALLEGKATPGPLPPVTTREELGRQMLDKEGWTNRETGYNLAGPLNTTNEQHPWDIIKNAVREAMGLPPEDWKVGAGTYLDSKRRIEPKTGAFANQPLDPRYATSWLNQHAASAKVGETFNHEGVRYIRLPRGWSVLPDAGAP